jgi:hypothetical protein
VQSRDYQFKKHVRNNMIDLGRANEVISFFLRAWSNINVELLIALWQK